MIAKGESMGGNVNQAAGIEFEYVDRPVGLQPEFAVPDARLQFLAIWPSIVLIDAVVAQPVFKLPGGFDSSRVRFRTGYDLNLMLACCGCFH
jgi:hypothetical protein